MIKFFTRSFNIELFLKSSALFRQTNYAIERLTDKSADGYFYAMLSDTECDVAINIDEDCFVVNPDAVLQLAQMVVAAGYANAGCPDCGSGCPRGGNPIVTNPFFNILNLKLIRSKFSRQAVVAFSYKDHKEELKARVPRELITGSHNFDVTDQEPYYPFFLWLAYEFKTLYLPAKRHNDGITTMLYDEQQNLVAEHTWFARFYTLPTWLVRFAQNDKGRQKQRIDNVITEVYKMRGMTVPKVSTLKIVSDRIVRWTIKIPQRISRWPAKLRRKVAGRR